MATTKQSQERLRLAVREALPKVLREGGLAGVLGGGDALHHDRDAGAGSGQCGQPESVRAAVGGERPGAAALSALRLRGTACQAAGADSTSEKGTQEQSRQRCAPQLTPQSPRQVARAAAPRFERPRPARRYALPRPTCPISGPVPPLPATVQRSRIIAARLAGTLPLRGTRRRSPSPSG